MRRFLPHPYLTLTLIVVWLLLINEPRIGSLVLGTVLGLGLPHLTKAYWPDRPKVNGALALARYGMLVAWDVFVANLVVARIVLFMPNARMQSAWIAVPMDLRTPEAITILAGTITLTPGTVTADMSACGRVLLVHSLHAPDPDAIRDEIKARYESRLKRIFE